MNNMDTEKLNFEGTDLEQQLGSQKWVDKDTLPKKRGWYITRDEEGDLRWRAWGCGAWWIQRRDGWLRGFNGDGSPMDYDWIPASRRKLTLDMWNLPSLDNKYKLQGHKKGKFWTILSSFLPSNIFRK